MSADDKRSEGPDGRGVLPELPPTHPWNGDSEGHNCADCPDGGVYRCYRDDHPCGCDVDYLPQHCPRFSEGLHRPLEVQP